MESSTYILRALLYLQNILVHFIHLDPIAQLFTETCILLSFILILSSHVWRGVQNVVLTVSSGDRSDSSVTVSSGDRSDSSVTVSSGDRSDSSVTISSGDRSDSSVTVSSGDRSDSSVTVSSGDRSDSSHCIVR